MSSLESPHLSISYALVLFARTPRGYDRLDYHPVKVSDQTLVTFPTPLEHIMVDKSNQSLTIWPASLPKYSLDKDPDLFFTLFANLDVLDDKIELLVKLINSLKFVWDTMDYNLVAFKLGLQEGKCASRKHRGWFVERNYGIKLTPKDKSSSGLTIQYFVNVSAYS